ncbi:unnamed protein product [Clonostachys rosea]|uniref:Uncharacterized protein n=1 Tax=Bionectria ochroleuca TaxID=29856 RepID=A0ABY6U716_BIOOC|nr:unnamed protein product [Clonostachys rosea]
MASQAEMTRVYVAFKRLAQLAAKSWKDDFTQLSTDHAIWENKYGLPTSSLKGGTIRTHVDLILTGWSEVVKEDLPLTLPYPDSETYESVIAFTQQLENNLGEIFVGMLAREDVMAHTLKPLVTEMLELIDQILSQPAGPSQQSPDATSQ